MLKITSEDLKSVAEQSRIYLTESETEYMLKNMNNIFEYISILDNYEPNTEVTNQAVANENRFREDISKPSISLEDALKNAPKKNENFFKVPKIIDNE